MKNKQSYQQLIEKMQEVSELSPQTVGPFTPVYKTFSSWFKSSVWKSLFLVSIIVTGAIWIVLKTSLVSVVSVLQHGF